MKKNENVRMPELRVGLSLSALDELKALSRRSGRTLDNIVATGLGLVKLMIDEERKGHILLVTQQDGTPIKQVTLK